MRPAPQAHGRVLAVKYFPVFFDLSGERVLVVGGGEVALRKSELLLRAGAKVSLVAPEILAELRQRAHDDANLTLSMREFQPDDLQGARLVIVATAQRALNRFIAKLADARHIPVNVVDDREASRFIVPAVVDRDPVLVAVSTAGASPVLARRLREKLEALLPAHLGAAARWLKGLRKAAKNKLRDTETRRRYFETLTDGEALRRFVSGDVQGAERIAQRLLAHESTAPRHPGEVTLVGAGPGDAELLTLKALRALQDADVILYDRLVSADVLDMARRDALRISVGKNPGTPGVSQDDINRLLIDYARQGKRVVRLKGGDPFIFGRGGEELEALAAAGIAFSVIPGITAASGCAAYAGIPLTHRDYAQSVTFVTGHAGEDSREPDWRSLAAPRHTSVFYMGLARLEHIVARLLEHGAKADLPTALIAEGTKVEQRIVTGTLKDIAALAEAANLPSPTLLIVGEVVALQGALAWFNQAEVDEASRSA